MGAAANSFAQFFAENQMDNSEWPNEVLIRSPGEEDHYILNTCFFSKHAAANKAAVEVVSDQMRDALGGRSH